MPRRSRKKHRRESRGRRAATAIQAPRIAAGRADGALDWIGGAGWQNPDTGRLHIETPIALHHDQGRTLQRTVDALRACPGIVARLTHRANRAAEVISMPLSREDADRMHAMLCSRAVKGRPDYRTAIRIGLGAGTAPEPPEVATTYRAMAATRPDGTPVDTIGDEWLATMDEQGRVDGGKKAGKAAADLSRMDKEPRWAAGAGFTRTPDQAPDIFIVLAIGRTPHEAAKRGWLAAVMLDVLKGPIALKVAPVHPIDAKLLRENFEQHLQNARKENEREDETHAGVALGYADDRIDAERPDLDWPGYPEDHQPSDGEYASLTTDSDGLPQLWAAGRSPVRYWREGTQ